MPCECLSKTVLRVFNGIFLLFGLAYIGLGVYMLVDDTFKWAGSEYAYGCFVLGAGIVVLAVIGLCGTTSRCAMWIYTIVLSLFIIGQLVLVIFALVNEGQLQDWLEDAWDAMDDQEQDELMKSLDCGTYNESPVTCGGDPNECFLDCYEKAKTDLQDAGSALMIIACCAAGVQALLLTASCCLICDDDYTDH